MSIAVYDYQKEAQRVKSAVRKHFPQDTIATEPGYNGRVHLKVVSEEFNGKSERQKQEIIWSILNEELHSDAQVVSLALAFGTDELP